MTKKRIPFLTFLFHQTSHVLTSSLKNENSEGYRNSRQEMQIPPFSMLNKKLLQAPEEFYTLRLNILALF